MAGIDLADSEERPFKIVQAIKQLLRGRSTCVGTITLRANQATTVVTKDNSPGSVNVSTTSEIVLQPRTANAAAAYATTYISSVGQGTFTITHANNAQVDKTFSWVGQG